MTRRSATRPTAKPQQTWQIVLLGCLFIAAAATSNWMINNVGQNNGPQAPRTINIGWGMDAPSGVLLIGLMIAVRDALHERVGIAGTLLFILVASLISAALAPTTIAVASGVTLLAAETTDALIYQKLRAKGRIWAAISSNLVSSLLDSGLFLAVAFGLLAAREGALALTIGKFEASAVTLAVMALFLPAFRPQGLRDRPRST